MDASSGYLLHGLPSLRAVPSDYAFNREFSTLRAPTQTLSEYQFSGLNSWRTATPNAGYHYVQAHELPRLIENEQVTKGNIISLKSLRERITHLDDGFYRPTLVNGVLYIVPSGDGARTARESPSDVKTAIEPAERCDTAREKQDEDDIRTARLPQSPHVKSAPEIRLSLKQLQLLLGRELYRDVIRKYKKERKAGHMGGTGSPENLEEDPFERSTHTARSSTSAHDAPESNVNTAVEPRASQHELPESGVFTAAEPSDGQKSSKDVSTAREATEHFGAALAGNVHTAISPAVTSSKDVTTAREITEDLRAALFNSNIRTAISPGVTSSKDVTTAREITDDLRASLAGNVRTAISSSDISSKDVATALEIDDNARAQVNAGFAMSGSTCTSPHTSEYGAQSNDMGQQAIGTLPVDAQRSITEFHGGHLKYAQTPEIFDHRASNSAKNLGVAPDQAHLASVEGETKTAVETPSETYLGGVVPHI